jgi:hypothetical protein
MYYLTILQFFFPVCSFYLWNACWLHILYCQIIPISSVWIL